MAPSLPDYPPTVVVFRTGLSLNTDLTTLQKHAKNIVKSIRRFRDVPVEDRFISIPEYQEDELRYFLSKEGDLSASIVVRPTGTFGDDQDFNEHIVDNPGQVVLVDASDFHSAQIEYAGRCNGDDPISPKTFASRFRMASCLARKNGVKLWGFQSRQGEGLYKGIQRKNASASTEYPEKVGFDVGFHYIRNLIVICKGSVGRWYRANFKEDLGRCVSEGQTGRYEDILVRWTGGRNAEDYATPEGIQAEEELRKIYGSKQVSKFIRHQTDPNRYKKTSYVPSYFPNVAVAYRERRPQLAN